MIQLTFPDKSCKEFDDNITPFQVAESISKSLAKKAVIAKINSKEVDLNTAITGNAAIEILTGDRKEALEVIRHDAAHLLAQAVKELFPDVQVTIGPSIENGFYYDFARKEPFTPKDLEVITKKMQQLASQSIPIEREVWIKEEAVKFFNKNGEKYKAEIISDIIPDGEEITMYRQGDFIDLCRGPHAPNTSFAKHFKLMKIAGAYWRGDSNNEMLQRIYGTAWNSKKELDEYLHRLEEAEKRDHRKLGKELSLFHIQEEAVGSVFWHENGTILYQLVQDYISKKIKENGYFDVKTPLLIDRTLWEKSGHWEKFRENMFIAESEGRSLALKPMNCPGHIQIFNKEVRSYKDLPLRMAEFGCCHRNEPSGALHGLMRVRSFVQDDAHIFCTEDQIADETKRFTNLLLEIYKDFGFEKVSLKFSDRPEKRAGTDAIWDKAEKSLQDAMDAIGLDYTLNPGEGAFYGPKIEFVLTDTLGRDWQCGTLQVDFVLPERLGAKYSAADGTLKKPVMLHRAILGSFERFIGILIEHYAGRFPFWLAPNQVRIITVSEKSADYASSVLQLLQENNFRVKLDDSADKIGYKIRKYSNLKVPVILIIGESEKENSTVQIRRLGSTSQENLALSEIVNRLNQL